MPSAVQRLVGAPVCTFDLRRDGDLLDRALAEPDRRDRVLVGFSDGPLGHRELAWARALDLTVVSRDGGARGAAVVAAAEPEPVLERIVASVEAHPLAATTLAGLLRWSGSLSIDDGLDAESHAYSMLLGGTEFRRWLDARPPRHTAASTGPGPAVPVPPAVRVERRGQELRITLDVASRRNAYSAQLRDELVAALAVAESDPSITRLLWTGNGPAFCAGGDLAEFGTTPDLVTAHLVRTRAGAARSLARLAPRTEVHLHGACVGAGIEMPAYADRLVVAPDTRIWLPEIAMGLIPGAGGTVSIPRRIGRWRTLYLAVTGAVLSAEEALEWGLVDDVDQNQT